MSNIMIVEKEERYCSVEESIRESLKEIKLMYEGSKKKNTLDDLWEKIDKWENEEEF